MAVIYVPVARDSCGYCRHMGMTQLLDQEYAIFANNESKVACAKEVFERTIMNIDQILVLFNLGKFCPMFERVENHHQERLLAKFLP